MTDDPILSKIERIISEGVSLISRGENAYQDILLSVMRSALEKFDCSLISIYVLANGLWSPIGNDGSPRSGMEIGPSHERSDRLGFDDIVTGEDGFFLAYIKFLGNVIGAVAAKKNDGVIGKKEKGILNAITEKISPLIESIRLIREREETFEQTKKYLEISGILNSSLAPKVVNEKAIEVVTRLLDCEVGSLLLVDEEKDELYFDVALGEKGEKVKEIRLKMGQGIAGWVAKNRRSLLVGDVKNDPRHFSGADERSEFKTKNMVCVPIIGDDKVIGVLQAINKRGGRRFYEEDVSLLESLAHQVAIAVENAHLHEELRDAFYQTAEALANAIEKRDPYTGDHTQRVMKYSLVIAHHMNLTEDEKENLKLAAILHDIGKIGVEDSILRKESELDNDEYDKIKRHPEFGEEILGHITMLKKVIPGMKHHHERPDGSGYPNGLLTGEIPTVAKIIAVADTFDAITTDRPYRKAKSREEALSEIVSKAGSQLDREVVDVFVKAYRSGEIK